MGLEFPEVCSIGRLAVTREIPRILSSENKPNIILKI